MTIDRRTVFSCHGVPVRMVGRRESGAVMVEYLTPRHHAPTATWREAWPHDLRAPGVGIGQIKSLAVVLPLVRLAFDDPPAIDVPASPAPAGPEQWWQKL